MTANLAWQIHAMSTSSMAEPATDLGTSTVLRMFPTFVWKAEFEPEAYRPLNTMIVSALSESRSRLPEHGEGWQSEQSLHELEELRGLVPLIEATVQYVLEFLEVGETAFEISACWANILPPGASHRMHSHPNNFLSGVYYAVTREGADTINFHDPRPQTGIVRPPVTKLTAENTDQVVVKVKDGTLLVFPSWLQHSVDTNKSSQQRISVSFNIMFSDYTEKMSKPLWRPRT